MRESIDEDGYVYVNFDEQSTPDQEEEEVNDQCNSPEREASQVESNTRSENITRGLRSSESGDTTLALAPTFSPSRNIGDSSRSSTPMITGNSTTATTSHIQNQPESSTSTNITIAPTPNQTSTAENEIMNQLIIQVEEVKR